MNGNSGGGAARKIRLILPAILRITFSLVLWTLGAATKTLTEAQTGKDRVTHELPSVKVRPEFH